MCFRVDCKQCGKHSWSGCGKHLASIYANIETGKHCMCRSWPGVVIPTDHNRSDNPQPPPPPPQASASAPTALAGLCAGAAKS